MTHQHSCLTSQCFTLILLKCGILLKRVTQNERERNSLLNPRPPDQNSLIGRYWETRWREGFRPRCAQTVHGHISCWRQCQQQDKCCRYSGLDRPKVVKSSSNKQIITMLLFLCQSHTHAGLETSLPTKQMLNTLHFHLPGLNSNRLTHQVPGLGNWLYLLCNYTVLHCYCTKLPPVCICTVSQFSFCTFTTHFIACVPFVAPFVVYSFSIYFVYLLSGYMFCIVYCLCTFL